MKKQLLIMAIASITATAGAYAQKERSPKEHFDQMKKELNLSDQQSVQILAILMEGKQKVDAARADGEVSDQEREELRKLRRSTDQRILALLDEEQQKKYQAAKKHMRRKGDPRMLKE